MKTSNRHIPFATLADLADLADVKIPSERVTLMAHVSDCSRCAAEFGQLTRLISLMREDTAEDAPRDLLAYAMNIFQQREPKPSLLRRAAASLSFDSATSVPAFGMRSGQAATRQILFAAEDSDLDLRISQQSDEWVVSGQLLASDCAGGEVELSNSERTTSTQLNDLCEFKLSPVPQGTYVLRVRFGETEIEVPQLDLRA